MEFDLQNRYQAAWEKIKTAKNILLVAHIHPDVDALSSLGIFIEILESLDKSYQAFACNKDDYLFNYLPHTEKVISNLEKVSDLEKFDLTIVVDCGSLSRTGLEKIIREQQPLANSRLYIIEFDHHPKIDNYSNLEIRHSACASTTEIIYYFLKANKIVINKNIANCLLAGILNDTGNFLYPSTNDTTIKIAAEMLNYGAQLPKIIQSSYQQKNLVSMKLWGQALKNLKVNQKYGLAISTLTQADIAEAVKGLEAEINSEIFGDIVGFLSNLGGMKAVLLVREETDGRVKINLRTSHPEIDVSKVAQLFGGGGHPKASGFLVKGKIEIDKFQLVQVLI